MDDILNPNCSALIPCFFKIFAEFKGSPYGFSLSQEPIEIPLSTMIADTNKYQRMQKKIITNDIKIDSVLLKEHSIGDALMMEDININIPSRKNILFKKILEASTNIHKKAIYLSTVQLLKVSNEFPMMIGITLNGLKLPPIEDKSGSVFKNYGEYNALIPPNFKELNADIILVNPDIIYHNHQFIQSFGLCKEKDDILRGLNLSILELPKNIFIENQKSDNINNNNDNDIENIDELKFNDLNLNDDDDDDDKEEMIRYAVINLPHEYPDHALIESIDKYLPKEKTIQQMLDDNILEKLKKESIKQNSSLGNGQLTSEIQQPEYIDLELFQKFIDIKWKEISYNNGPTSLDNISIKIHNAIKHNDGSSLWKSVDCPPDDDKKDYTIKMELYIELFVDTRDDQSNKNYYPSKVNIVDKN
jgi:hypothetical protein